MKTDLILIGGFLGAGKTTFLKEMSKFLAARGQKVGLITNDQATALVDTAFLRDGNDNVIEVSGSCFCCNYNGFMDAASSLRQAGMDTIMAEPVGSCTDLSATIMQPLKEKSARDFKIYPLSVMVDPDRLKDILDGGSSGLHPGAVYIVGKQLEEADLIVVNKADLLSPEEMEPLLKKTKARFPGKPVLAVSAKNGTGFAEWLDTVSSAEVAGSTIADVDYDVYAEGEAVLGWLNMAVRLERPGADWDAFAGKLLESLAFLFDDAGLPVAHVKIMLESGGKATLGNITGNKDTARQRGKAGKSDVANLTINARVETAPETLLSMVENFLKIQCVAESVRCDIEETKCLSPGRPNPTYRYEGVVA